ncbi:hypothetical protein [Thermoanaerobacter thermohydrosulfuricus]|uniref:hypothetical protein n=1 Tax=Thermoanaerobacter thermohydrosulfuricus TaxID=1516 RepID=UPI003D2EBBB7
MKTKNNPKIFSLINWEKTNCEIVTALIDVKVAPQQDLGFNSIAQEYASLKK